MKGIETYVKERRKWLEQVELEHHLGFDGKAGRLGRLQESKA